MPLYHIAARPAYIGNKIMSHSHKVSLFDEVVVLTPLPPLLLLFLLLMKTRADIVVVVSAGAGAIMMEMLYIAEEISGRLIHDNF